MKITIYSLVQLAIRCFIQSDDSWSLTWNREKLRSNFMHLLCHKIGRQIWTAVNAGGRWIVERQNQAAVEFVESSEGSKVCEHLEINLHVAVVYHHEAVGQIVADLVRHDVKWIDDVWSILCLYFQFFFVAALIFQQAPHNADDRFLLAFWVAIGYC